MYIPVLLGFLRGVVLYNDVLYMYENILDCHTGGLVCVQENMLCLSIAI